MTRRLAYLQRRRYGVDESFSRRSQRAHFFLRTRITPSGSINQVSREVTSFFEEETPALQRMSQDFARTLVRRTFWRPSDARQEFSPAEKIRGRSCGPQASARRMCSLATSFLSRPMPAGALQHLVPGDMRDFSLHDLDLAQVSVAEVLDARGRPRSWRPFRFFFVRGVKELTDRLTRRRIPPLLKPT